jgi:predicted Zn-ribbon and HTH transcriptional regulator
LGETYSKEDGKVEKRILDKRSDREKLYDRMSTVMAEKYVIRNELRLYVLRCPVCGFNADRAFEDLKGHKLIKCPKCKASSVIDIEKNRRLLDI